MLAPNGTHTFAESLCLITSLVFGYLQNKWDPFYPRLLLYNRNINYGKNKNDMIDLRTIATWDYHQKQLTDYL
jgi:hypothetical protein